MTIIQDVRAALVALQRQALQSSVNDGNEWGREALDMTASALAALEALSVGEAGLVERLQQRQHRTKGSANMSTWRLWGQAADRIYSDAIRIAELTAERDAARADGFAECREMAATWLDGEAQAHGNTVREVDDDESDVELALMIRFQQAAARVRALKRPEPPKLETTARLDAHGNPIPWAKEADYFMAFDPDNPDVPTD